MKTDLTTRLRGGVRTEHRELAQDLAPPVTPPHQATPAAPTAMPREHAARRNAPFHMAQAVVAWGLCGLLAGIAAIIVGVWVVGGNVTDVHTMADLLTSIGRITGLFG